MFDRTCFAMKKATSLGSSNRNSCIALLIKIATRVSKSGGSI
jgi:hypothetical protein